MMTMPPATHPARAAAHDHPHLAAGADVAAAHDSDSSVGLSTAEAARRLTEVGPNALAETARIPAWRRLLDQFRDVLIMVLLAAALISFFVSGELKTPLVVLTVVLLNAVIGFVQESKAENSLAALRKMLVSTARVRRDGSLRDLPAPELVPGDIVLFEAGDRVPADGRLLETHALEIEEAALTGESHPTEKSSRPVEAYADEVVALGDRHNMAYMNTVVTRGRGEMVVTATGMHTEIGRIAGLLYSTEIDKTPLQKQLDKLAHSLAKLAGLIVLAVIAIGLIRGEPISDLLMTAVALAVASIPEGLPAVTAVTLAIGVSKMAKRNAIVKRLAAVETLGCTTVICSDKTGTLTLSEMTAVELVVQQRAHRVTGSGYSPVGEIERVVGDEPISIDAALLPMALCNDAVLRFEPATDSADADSGDEGDEGDGTDGAWTLVGDPTEGALLALAAKGDVNVADLRSRHPRLAEVPFDSANKFMMTAHEMVSSNGEPVVRIYVKGAPDVLLRKSTNAIDEHGSLVDISTAQHTLLGHNDRLADQGRRVIAVAQRELSHELWSEFVDSSGDPIDLVADLTLLALIGIVDPPRPEARQAIAEAHAAGIQVKMITGDHAVTAAAIGRELGLRGRAINGADLDSMSDEELAAQLDDIGVFARVSPQHKLRLVGALQAKGNVVAMTGDGVNDAPALKRADMGVAMGITGTEVTKEAATMVLTDDNFATIVGAVKRGRTIYDNIVNFVRFQLSTTLGFATLFLLAGILGIADGKPFTAIAILWVNIIMDGPPAMALGLDPAGGDVMARRPRPANEPILTRRRWTAVGLSAAVMAIGTLAVLALAPGGDNVGAAGVGAATVAGTMAFNTFVLFQFWNILNARSDSRSVVTRDTFRNGILWLSLTGVVLLQIGVTHVGFLQRLFDTTSISAAQWLVCIAVASIVLWVEEIHKFFIRRQAALRAAL